MQNSGFFRTLLELAYNNFPRRDIQKALGASFDRMAEIVFSS